MAMQMSICREKGDSVFQIAWKGHLLSFCLEFPSGFKDSSGSMNSGGERSKKISGTMQVKPLSLWHVSYHELWIIALFSRDVSDQS